MNKNAQAHYAKMKEFINKNFKYDKTELKTSNYTETFTAKQYSSLSE